MQQQQTADEQCRSESRRGTQQRVQDGQGHEQEKANGERDSGPRDPVQGPRGSSISAHR
jgi:hypothetical protein